MAVFSASDIPIMKVPFTFQDGDKVGSGDLDAPESSRPDFRSCFVFAFPKSGSVLVNALVQSVMSEWGVPVIDVPTQLYQQGIDIAAIQCDLSSLFVGQGYCYSGFRELPRSMLGSGSIGSARKILIVRDPRDMLVSRYYSTKYSHGFAKRGSSQFGVPVLRLHSADTGAYAESGIKWKMNGVLANDRVDDQSVAGQALFDDPGR